MSELELSEHTFHNDKLIVENVGKPAWLDHIKEARYLLNTETKPFENVLFRKGISALGWSAVLVIPSYLVASAVWAVGLGIIGITLPLLCIGGVLLGGAGTAIGSVIEIPWLRKRRRLVPRRTASRKALKAPHIQLSSQVDDNGHVTAVIALKQTFGRPKQVHTIALGRENQEHIAQRYLALKQHCNDINQRNQIQLSQALRDHGLQVKGSFVKLDDNAQATNAQKKLTAQANRQLMKSLES